MRNEGTTYYLICGRLVGRKTGYDCFLFQEGEWQEDRGWVIMDRLMGYDPSEPPDSPDRFGSLSVLDEIEEISYETAMLLTGGKA